MIIRRYKAGDEDGAIDVFLRSVRELGPAKYSQEQVCAWIAGRRDPALWAARMSGRETFVACDDERIIGWIEMESDGHLDFLYCAPEAAGKGVAGALYDVLIARAHENGLGRLFAEASRFAEPFFLKRGWSIDAREAVVREGVEIERARMSLVLTGPERGPVSDGQNGFDSTYLALSKSVVYRAAVRYAFPSLPEWVVPYSHLDGELLERIAAAMGLEESSNFIDLACGLGGPGLWIATQSGASVTGVDFSAAAVQAARDLAATRALRDARFICADIVDTGLPDASFDAAMCIDAMIFAPPRDFAREVARVLKPGGRLAATTWEALDDSLPLPTLVADYRPILEAAGLSILEHEVIDAHRELGRALFSEIVSREEYLRAELGESAEGLVAEAHDFLDRLKRPTRVRRMFLVAEKA